MGNQLTSLVRRHNSTHTPRDAEAEGGEFVVPPPSSEESQQTTPERAATRRYMLRRTFARIRRRVGTGYPEAAADIPEIPTANDNSRTTDLTRLLEPLAASTTSVSSRASRRRRREEEDEGDMPEGRGGTRRPRLENLTRDVFSPEPEGAGPAIYFYFPLPVDDAATAGMAETGPSVGVVGTDSSASMVRTAEPSTSVAGTEPSARPQSRIQRATEYFRTMFGHGSRTFPSSPSVPPEATTQNHMVLVRIRQLPVGEQTSNPNVSGVGSGANEESSSSAPNSDVRSVFQWTIYFVMPRPEGAEETSSAPPAFDAHAAVQRAFSVLRAMMSGENMTHEDWLRLQEMMGTAHRGVAKEKVEEQCAAHLFSNLGTVMACPICLAEFVVEESIRTLPCTHSYHAECIDTWLGSTNNCPLCRQAPIKP